MRGVGDVAQGCKRNARRAAVTAIPATRLQPAIAPASAPVGQTPPAPSIASLQARLQQPTAQRQPARMQACSAQAARCPRAAVAASCRARSARPRPLRPCRSGNHATETDLRHVGSVGGGRRARPPPCRRRPLPPAPNPPSILRPCPAAVLLPGAGAGAADGAPEPERAADERGAAGTCGGGAPLRWGAVQSGQGVLLPRHAALAPAPLSPPPTMHPRAP